MADTQVPTEEYLRARQVVAAAMNENNAEMLFDAVSMARDILLPFIPDANPSDDELATLDANLRKRP